MVLGIMAAINLVAAFILTIPLYYRRHRRRDLVTAFAVLNVAVFAVAAVLGSSTVGIGVGMGLFGVLSIIRLRSTLISESDIAYYFSALSIGLIAGLTQQNVVIAAALIALILLTVTVVDARHILPASRHQHMRLDRAFTDEDELREHVEHILGFPVTNLEVISTDFVHETTKVDVRWTRKAGETHSDNVAGLAANSQS